MGEFTAAEKLAAAEREIKQRERVYPRLVEAGKMSAAQASFQTGIMHSIAEDYRVLAEKERML